MFDPGFKLPLSLASMVTLLLGILAMTTTPAQVQKRLLTDPFLQLPTSNSVNVVWFTEFQGSKHTLIYGNDRRQVAAQTTELSHLRDATQTPSIGRRVWRHEATASDLVAGHRVPYWVSSQDDTGLVINSKTFSLQPIPPAGKPIRILLTSDHQLMPNTHINLQKVQETIGLVDAVFVAGDLVNTPDHWNEWFSRGKRGFGFFPALQGTAQQIDPDSQLTGGEVIQHAHLLPVIGNHEVMGRVNPITGLAEFGGDQPRWVAEMLYANSADSINPQSDPTIRQQWIQDHSWNTRTYEEIFSLPTSSPGGKQYYSVDYGDIFLLSLFMTRPWRMPSPTDPSPGKYQEAQSSLSNPNQWGFGDFLYEPYGNGSKQYNWITNQLASAEFQTARYKLVMTHQISRGFGENTIPLLTDPTATFTSLDLAGNSLTQKMQFPLTSQQWETQIKPILPTLKSVRYDYEKSQDPWHRDLEPLLEKAGVNIVLHGHSHLWYRIRTPTGMNILETSNVGNSYGAYLPGYKQRKNLPPAETPDRQINYAEVGDPYGSEAEFPSLFSPQSDQAKPLPTVDSNDLTVFSILDTGLGTIASYIVDLKAPGMPVRKFDEFKVGS